MLKVFYVVSMLLTSVVQQHIDVKTKNAVCPARYTKKICWYDLHFSKFIHNRSDMRLRYDVRHGTFVSDAACVKLKEGTYEVIFSTHLDLRMTAPFTKQFTSYYCESPLSS